MSVRLDRFRAPDSSDEIARCQSCGERFHYTQMDEHGFCPTCQPDEDEDNDMTEKEMMELNAYLAEHVMGWRRVNYALESKDSFCVFDSGVYVYASKNTMVPFSPTTDPAAAMQVLEKCAMKLSPDGGGRAIAIEWNGDIVESFSVIETDIANGISVEANDLPLAIALFARKLYETKT